MYISMVKNNHDHVLFNHVMFMIFLPSFSENFLIIFFNLNHVQVFFRDKPQWVFFFYVF